MMHGRVLVVDDAIETLELLKIVLAKQGYLVVTAKTLKQASQEIGNFKPDLIILDIKLPDGNGMQFTENLKLTRQYSDIPIILLTSKDTNIDIIKGLKTGADDYIVKPFDKDVLIARTEAVLRRCRPEIMNKEKISAGSIDINISTRQVYADGVEIALTPSEYNILYKLVQFSNKPVDRSQLFHDACEKINERIIDTHVTSLRKKLGQARKYLRTVHGVGYKIIA